MIEFVAGIVLLIIAISARKLWQEYIVIASERTSLWAKEIENDLQPKIEQVYNERKDLITSSPHKKWLTVDDIDKLR